MPAVKYLVFLFGVKFEILVTSLNSILTFQILLFGQKISRAILYRFTGFHPVKKKLIK
jgi:hypothetical protein